MQRLVLGWSLILSLAGIANYAAAEETTDTLRVMSFNMWQGGEAGGQSLSQSIRVIEASQADIVGLQETGGAEREGTRPDNAERIAQQLAWHYFDQGDATGVLSRYPIVSHTPKKWGVQIELPSGRQVWIFNVHLSHAPYQPYQLLNIPYADAPFLKTAEEAVTAARASRGKQLAAMLKEAQAIARREAVFITGDFNEPSALDWTDTVFGMKRCPQAVDWPSTRAVLDAGFLDAYREIHPDPIESPGYTWTSTTAEDDPRDHHDRIDFVFVRGDGARVHTAEIVGERTERADIVVTPYPSDHRAVVAMMAIE